MYQTFIKHFLCANIKITLLKKKYCLDVSQNHASTNSGDRLPVEVTFPLEQMLL